MTVKQKMIAMHLSGAPSEQGHQITENILKALADGGPLAGMDKYGREGFYAGMMAGVLIHALLDIGEMETTRIMVRLIELLEGCTSENKQQGATLQ